MDALPRFPYLRDPIASGAVIISEAVCDCCGKARGAICSHSGYAIKIPDSLCPWCVADGSAEQKYDLEFFDGYFCDAQMNSVSMPAETHRKVFARTPGFATLNPIGWWVHCGEPAEYITRLGLHDLIFECRTCHNQQVIKDFD